MKKSRILVPALAMIAFSTAASVAGSVAWFTANRKVTVNAGTYTVVKTTANLEVAVTAGIATTVTDNVVSLGTNVLTDGSFNHKTGKIYEPDATGTEIETENNYNCSAADLERGELSDGGKIYSAATFQLVFTISYGSASGDYGLFLDNSAGKTNFAVDGGAAAATAQGFRMAFYPTGSGEHGRATVLADLQSAGTWDHDGDGAETSPTAEVNKIRYVSSTSNYVGTDYVATDYDLINSAYDAAMPTTAPSKTSCNARPDYLGYFAFNANSDVTLTYTVVCWFEGTDPSIVPNATNFQSVISTLCFEAIKQAD